MTRPNYTERLPVALHPLAETMDRLAQQHLTHGNARYTIEYTVFDDGDYRLRYVQLLETESGSDPIRDTLVFEADKQHVRHFKVRGTMTRGSTIEHTVIADVDAPYRLFDGASGDDVGRDPR